MGPVLGATTLISSTGCSLILYLTLCQLVIKLLSLLLCDPDMKISSPGSVGTSKRQRLCISQRSILGHGRLLRLGLGHHRLVHNRTFIVQKLHFRDCEAQIAQSNFLSCKNYIFETAKHRFTFIHVFHTVYSTPNVRSQSAPGRTMRKISSPVITSSVASKHSSIVIGQFCPTSLVSNPHKRTCSCGW